MTQERAQEILKAINSSPFSWDQNIDKFLQDGEREAVNQVWDTMPGHWCWARTLQHIAKGGK